MSASLIGQKLGKYQVVQLVGQGGMSTVYKAYQADVDRFVALKVLPPHPGRDPQFAERFRREATTVARLQHPHILPLYDFGQEGEILYLVTTLIEGGALSERIRRGPMPLPEVERILGQIAPALDYAHRNNIIHRDIKPDNILINSDGYAMLSDFGIARIVQAGASMTLSGSLMGTPAYMSPEQGQGLAVSPASDLYSLGVVAYEMLTGEQPFTAETPMQVVMKHMNERPPSILDTSFDLPALLDDVINKALSKTPEQRYPSAVAFLEDFVRAAHGQTPLLNSGAANHSTIIFDDQGAPTPTPLPSSTTAPARSAARRSPVLLFAGAVVALLAIAAVVIALQSNSAAVNLPPGNDNPAPGDNQQAARPSFGRVRFSSSEAVGDTVNVQVQNLQLPPAGLRYAVWLQGENGTVPLGALDLDALGSGALTYTDPDGRMLPALAHTVMIAEAETPGSAPGENIIYSGSVPAEVSRALGAIFVESDDGIDGGSLLDGLMSEATIAQSHAGFAASATTPGAMHQHAEHTVNILLGTRDDLNNDGAGQNPGHGEGIVFFLDRIEALLSEASHAPGASRALQSQAELLRVCTQNTRERMNQLIELERALLASETVEAVAGQAEQSTILAEALLLGSDLNNNGQVEPFEGECGIEQVPTFGVLVGNMEIHEGAPIASTTAEAEA